MARKAIEKKVEDLEMLEKLASKSKLTERDVEEISRKINEKALKGCLHENCA